MTSIHPGLILGPRFWKPSESVAQIVQFVNQGAPVYFDGGFSVVDVDDVARGAIVAMERGRTGERYILAGENVTVKQLFDLMAELTGLRAPSIKLPVGVLRVIAAGMELVSRGTGRRPMIGVCGAPSIKLPVGVLRVIAAGMELVSRVTGRRPMIDPSQVDEFGGRYAYFDSAKAVRELGYSFLSARETVRRTIAWIVERGFVTEQRRRVLRLDASVGAAAHVDA